MSGFPRITVNTSNRYRGKRPPLHRSRHPVLANIQGGLSGPAIKPMAFLRVHQVCKKHHIPIIGQGNIASAEDTIEFLIAGAIGTALFYDPLICAKINDGIRSYLQRQGLEKVSDLIGSLVLPNG